MKKVVALFSLVFILCPFVLTACWDSRDIEELHIVTGVALDISKEDESMIDLTLQITNIHSGGSTGPGQAGGGDEKPIILKKSAKSVSGVLNKLNSESNRYVFLHHIEVLLLSMDLAKKGINDYIDFFLRDTQARLEIPLIIVDGRAEDVLKAEIQEENQSSLYLADSFQSAKKISNEIHVRLIDIAFKLVCRHHCPIVPVVKVEKEEENEKITDVGFVMIKDSKATEIFKPEDIYGFVFVKDNVHFVELELFQSEQDNVVLKLINLEPKTSVKIEGEKITVVVNINAESSVSEIEGFKELNPSEQIELFKQLLKEDIEKRIHKTFAIAQDNSCDFYGISEIIHKKNARVWARLKDRWDEIFPTVEMKLEIKTQIKSTGQTVDTLEMEKVKNDHR